MATDRAQSSSSHVTFQNVSNLSVFKTVSTGVTADTRDVLVASVTPQEPRFMRVANGMKVVGSLDAGRATVRVELVKREDCQSEFTCHVRGLDSQGREVVSTASLVQQPRHRENQVDDGKVMPSLSLQLLASIQQLVTQSVAGLEDKIDSLEHRLDHKLEGMEHRLMKELEQGEDKIDDKLRRFQRASADQSDTFERVVQNRLLLLENRLEDKIDRNSNRNNFIRHYSNYSIELGQFRSDLKTMISDTLGNHSLRLEDIQNQGLNAVVSQVKQITDNTSLTMCTMRNNSAGTERFSRTDLQTLKNQTDSLQEMMASVEVSSHHMWRDILASNGDLKGTMRNLESNILNSTAVSWPELRDLVSHPDFWRPSDDNSLMKNTLAPKTCKKNKGMIFAPALISSQYTMINAGKKEDGAFEFPHVCDIVTDGGGWILIQRRSTGNIDFNRLWDDYKTGFGSFYDDFWLGNDKLHAITSNGSYELEVTMKFKGKKAYARYVDFAVGNETENYKLSIGRYFGTAGDSLSYHNGAPFSTLDRDNDEALEHCVEKHGGGWWFKKCDTSNLNGNWRAGSDFGLEWTKFAGADSVSYSELKIRRV
ncbi:tenascin-R [Elysia marginata]|uniref:Tenascin-R n=1 Tax=Elysia marginata TaxID=1093978 RepID=A0AAV4JUM5_9GAST|nr:tenascin-R [Elysia marginata]